jgi:hypothetical protein
MNNLNAHSANSTPSAVLEKEYVVHFDSWSNMIRKETELDHALQMKFSWTQILDVVADVYNGVSIRLLRSSTNICSTCFGPF